MVEPTTAEQVQKFRERALQQFPAWNEKMADAERRGLNLSPAHTAEMFRICVPEVAYHLADPANEALARQWNVADGQRRNDARCADEVRRLASRIKRHDVYTKIEVKQSDTDEYLAQRKADIRAGKRGR